ncbi:GNAT family N-acetyltransferase [Aspergillus tanneri]|nr:uncharacterized protein ATNIH1004_007300 [Aspergillus tanneri]KAA8645879.1 hypothetical protein ATNIH1004_007300 [Aspergillus tanneri]
MDQPIVHEVDISALIPSLQSHLPYSLPLLRRLQHSRIHVSSTAKYLTTVSPSSSGTGTGTETGPSPWLAAWVDLHARPETQVIIYSSLEALPLHVPSSHDTLDWDRVRAQLLALLSYIKTRLMPEYLQTIESNASASLNASPVSRAFKIGHLHTKLFSLLTVSGEYIPNAKMIPGLRVHRYDYPPYNKYLFAYPPVISSDTNTNTDTNTDVELSPGYSFTDRHGHRGLSLHHYELICRRSSVPRTPKSLATFFGVAIYAHSPVLKLEVSPSDGDGTSSSDGDGDRDTDDPVAWAFLSAEGTLAVLHVEPEHRGRGLALLASRAVMRRGMTEDGIWGGSGQKVWVHADVLPQNMASCRVMEKLGGVVGWSCTWTDLEFD